MPAPGVDVARPAVLDASVTGLAGEPAPLPVDARRESIWTTGTANQGGSRLVNQSDGNFVLYSPDNRALWNSGTSGRGATTVLTQTDGNVVSYAGASPVWNTYTAGGVSRLASSSAVAFARRQLGKPYVYGSAGPNSYDCSGLTMATYATVGVSLPHRASDQFRLGTPVDASQLIPGDLVFSYSGPGHVGIYVGNGLMISSPNSNSAVRYDPAGEYGNYVGARRVA